MDLLPVWNYIAQAAPNETMMLIDKIARVPISKILIFAVILSIIRFASFSYLKKTPIHKREGGYKALKFVNEMADALVYAAIVVFMLVRPFGIQTFHIPSESMVDTLRVKDFIVANKFIYRTRDPKAGEVVVFKPPKRATRPETENSDFIKRTIGTPGQVIEYKKGVLYRDGKAVDEAYYTLTESSGNGAYTVPLKGSDFELAKGQQYDWKLVKKSNGDLIPFQYNSEAGVGNMMNSVVPEYLIEDEQERLALMSAEPQPIPEGYFLMWGDNRNGSDDGRRWGLVPRESIIGRAEVVWFPLSRMKKIK